MNFKRVAALLLAGAMVMTAVPVYAKGDDVTLSVSIWDTNQEPGIKEILADFTEKTGIKTEISVVKWDEYWTMLEAGAQGGDVYKRQVIVGSCETCNKVGSSGTAGNETYANLSGSSGIGICFVYKGLLVTWQDDVNAALFI